MQAFGALDLGRALGRLQERLEARGERLHTRNHKSEIPLENTTANPLDSSSKLLKVHWTSENTFATFCPWRRRSARSSTRRRRSGTSRIRLIHSSNQIPCSSNVFVCTVFSSLAILRIEGCLYTAPSNSILGIPQVDTAVRLAMALSDRARATDEAYNMMSISMKC